MPSEQVAVRAQEEAQVPDIQNDLYAFIKKHAEGRICNDTRDFYKAPTEKTLMVAEYFKKADHSRRSFLIGVSVCSFDKTERVARNCITVVHKDHRGKGIGQKLLAKKLEVCRQLKIKYKTSVAADNAASLTMCIKSGLQIVDQKKSARRTGEFLSISLESM